MWGEDNDATRPSGGSCNGRTSIGVVPASCNESMVILSKKQQSPSYVFNHARARTSTGEAIHVLHGM